MHSTPSCAFAAYTAPANLVLNSHPPIAGDSPTIPRFAPKCFDPNSSITNVGIAQNSAPKDAPMIDTPNTRNGEGAPSGRTANTAIPPAIAINNHTVNSARVVFPEELSVSETDPLANRPNVFAHARSFNKPCEKPPALSLCSSGNADTICAKLLITVMPDPNPNSNVTNRR